MRSSHVPVAHRWRLAALAASGAFVVGLAACGDDDTAAGGAEGNDVDLVTYCAAEVAQAQVFQQLDADAPGFAAALEEAQPVVDAVVASAPEELATPIGIRADAFAAVRASGDPDQFFTDEVTAADDAVHAYDLEHCGWQQAEITAEDYRYAGDFPTRTGTVSFELTNTGEEPHLLLVARKKADVEGRALDVFNALDSEDELPASFDMVASVFIGPGEDAWALADLEPGDYVAFCPLPVGTTFDNNGETDGPPHFTQGQVTAFEVVAP
jgi:hypothetical protein